MFRPILSARCLLAIWGLACLAPSTGRAQGVDIHYVDQGAAWTPEARAKFYTQDQGSQLIPLAWLQALKQLDGKPFMEGALARYGYLPNPADGSGLPIGFTRADSAQGPMAGMTCAACHTRQISVGTTSYRIDGGPAFADFQTFLLDLDSAVRRVLASDAAFRAFAGDVLGAGAEASAVRSLHSDVVLWSVRWHTLMSRAVPVDKPWGPTRVDAMSMIYDRLVGLDLGAAPSFLIPDNIVRADAPARYPFLWNAPLQDVTQWAGFQKNGSDVLALARNLGQSYGIFVRFHPRPPSPGMKLNTDYIGDNSANLAGLQALEALEKRLGPPKWPWPIDIVLAARGKAIFDRPTDRGGCVACHGIAPGEARDGATTTWRTPILDVGTDTREWTILLRSAKSGSLNGAAIPGFMDPIREKDLAIDILKTSVIGAIIQKTAPVGPAQASAPDMPPAEMADMLGVYRMPEAPKPKVSSPSDAAPIRIDSYEARVLQGIWAAAPYLHNGSVPTLAELLKPPARRVKDFKIGPAYDPTTVGLAPEQTAFDFTLRATGCEDRNSGNSNCGHAYGTTLPEGEKRALLEYLKTM